MDPRLTPIVWFIFVLPVLLLLQRWIHRHLRGLAYLVTGRMQWSILIYAIVLFPGVVLHELSHWVVARLVGVRTGAISLVPQVQKDGTLRLGYVEYYRSRSLDPVRESLIGGAPLVSGATVILLIGLHVFDINNLSVAVQSASLDLLSSALTDLFTAPDFMVWLYLIFAISNAMMPSPSDRRAWPLFFILLAIAGVALYFLDVQQAIIGGLVGPITVLFGYLALAFSLAVGVDLVFIFAIYLLESLISRLRGVELVYEARDT